MNDPQTTEMTTMPVRPLATVGERSEVAEFIKIGLDKGLSVEAMDRFYAMWKEQEERKAKAAWVDAMRQFSAQRPKVKRTHVNSFIKVTRVTANGQKISDDYRYAGLSDIEEALARCGDFGIMYRWGDEKVDNAVMALGCAVSVGSHTEVTTVSAPVMVNKGTSQASLPVQLYQGTRTSLQRASLMLAFGLASVDDDTDGREPPSSDPQATPAEPAPAPAKLSTASAQEIRDLLKATDSDAAKFLALFKVAAVEDLTAEQYVAAMKMFGKKIAAAKAKAVQPS